MKANKIEILLSVPFNKQVIKNRILPIISSGIDRGFSVELISPDKTVDQVDLLRFKHTCSNSKYNLPKNFILRAFYELFISWQVFKKAQKKNSTITFISIPSPMLLFLSIFIRGKVIIDVRDITWEFLNEKALFQNVVKKIFLYLSKIALNKAWLVTTSNSSEKNYFENSLIILPEVILLKNGISKERFDTLRSISHSGSKEITYIGNIGLAQNLLLLCEAAQNIPKARFNIIGSGPELKLITKYVQKENIKNIFIYGKLDWEDILPIYAKSSILYAQLSRRFDIAMPSKIYEYLSTGKAIIYGGGGHAKSFLSSFENVNIIVPDDKNELENAINDMLENKTYLKKSKSNIDLIEKNYIREKSIANFYNYLEKKIN